jgi:hypothetical protein
VFSLTLPKDLKPEKSAVIIYAQHATTFKVLGATKVTIPIQNEK